MLNQKTVRNVNQTQIIVHFPILIPILIAILIELDC